MARKNHGASANPNTSTARAPVMGASLATAREQHATIVGVNGFACGFDPLHRERCIEQRLGNVALGNVDHQRQYLDAHAKRLRRQPLKS